MDKMKIMIDKQRGYAVLGLMAVMVLAVAAMPLLKNSETPQETTPTTPQPSPSTTVLEKKDDLGVKVEVIHFHATNQCWSCIRLGELAEKTVDTYYKDELASGKLVFGHIDGQKAENGDLVMKYGARGSSLFIGTYVNGEFHKEENVQVWYKLNNEEDYMSYLKGILDKRLNGDLS